MRTNRLHMACLASCCVAVALALMGAAPALATGVAVYDGKLLIDDALSQPNALEVHPTGLGYDVLDDLTELTAGSGCVLRDPLNPHDVVCGGAITAIVVAARGGADVVSLADVAIPVVVFGGPDGDLIEGGSGDDHLEGGTGPDTISGGAGDDWIRGDANDDLLQGDDGSDDVAGGSGADIVQGLDGS